MEVTHSTVQIMKCQCGRQVEMQHCFVMTLQLVEAL